jgi:hypothetical protein
MARNLPARIPFRDTLAAGLITSQIAAVIMAVVMVIVFAAFLGKPPLYPVQVIGSTVYGESALVGLNVPALFAGLVLHLAVALAWGFVFCLAAAALDVRTAVMAGILGIVVAAVSMVDSYVVVPHVFLSLHGEDIWNREVPIFWNWAAHLVLGASFAFYPVVLEKIENMRHATPPGHIAAH